MKRKEGLQTRAIRADLTPSGEEGVIEGYIAVWDTVDSYNSVFVRGCFKDTIKLRGDRVKVIDDHETLIGKSISIMEDDHGVKVQGKINIDTVRGMDVFKLIQDGTYDGLSFGFSTPPNTVQSKNGIDYITKVQLYEYGPVIFPSNENAVITGTRSTNYLDTLEDKIESSIGWKLLEALDETICDIRWSGNTDMEQIVALLDKAISDFHGAFLLWAKDYYLDSVPPGQDIYHLLSRIGSAEDIVANSPLDMQDIGMLRKGFPVAQEKLDKYPALGVYNRELRKTSMEKLCSMLRNSGLKPAEKSRLTALLDIDPPPRPEQEISGLADQIKQFRESLKPTIGA